MKLYEATFKTLDALEELQFPYLLVGSLAGLYYGLNRNTMDADFVVQLAPGSIGTLADRMGAGFRREEQQSFELFTGKTIHQFMVEGTPFRIDVFPLSSDPFDQERFRRRRPTEIQGRMIVLPTAEDFIVQKLRWRRPKDLDDALEVLGVQSPTLDWAYIERWCDEHRNREILEQLRRDVDDI